MLYVWRTVVFLLFLASSGKTQTLGVFEGSAEDSGDTVAARFVESTTDEIIIANSSRSCVEKAFRGTGFQLKGILYRSMFICPNGEIKFDDDIYQNYPYNYGTRPEQRTSPSVSPYWTRVDLLAFATGDSKVRFASYHNDTNPRAVVFNKVNQDVKGFSNRPDFEATWVAVVTFEDIRPHDRIIRGFQGKNTFQAVFVSDDTSWYLMYNYADIDWAVGVPRSQYDGFIGQAGLPVMGWNAGERSGLYRDGDEFTNLPLSGTVNAEDIDDFEGNLGQGRWIFNTSRTLENKSPELLCQEWSASTIVIRRRSLQCPRTIDQADFDKRFKRQNKFNRICYVRFTPRGGAGLRCCYGSGTRSLLTGIQTPGGYLSQNPYFFDVSEDDAAYENCCILSDICQVYRNRRPKPDGIYRPSKRAYSYGDPHYGNLDNLNYTFNGCGDYMFLATNNKRFQIQVRFSQAVGAGMGTVISAVAIKQEGVNTVQVNHNKNGSQPMLLHINGTEYANYADLTTDPAIVQDSIVIIREGDNELQILTEDDHSIVVTREPENLVVVIALDPSVFGMTMGLLGNWSNTVEDDFILPNGTSLGFPLTDEQIHYDFGESWRLTPEDNFIINTTADENFSCSETYRPIFVSNFTFPNNSIRAAATSICGGNINCIFDVAATLLPSFGETTMESFDTIENEITVAENNAPTFGIDSVVFNLTLGEVFEYTIDASDVDGDPLQFTSTNIPPGGTVQRNRNEITFRWLVNTTQAFNLSFLVEDNKNGSSILFPQFSVCPCKNGMCVKQARSEEQTDVVFIQHEVLNCRCDIGYIGEFCDRVRDFCQTQSGSPCHPLSNCTNSPTNYICGDCPAGYSGDGFDCIDNDECDEGTDNCEMFCVNNGGSFVCQCPDGYRLDDNLRNCSDINECTTAHDCQQNCTNTEGSFSCSCNVNFIVDPVNPKNCIPRTACPTGNPCQHVCAIDGITGSQICSCNRGFMVDPDDGTKCIDFDECAGVSNLCNQRCINTDGSFTCSCLSGYEIAADNVTCQDLNECVISGMFTCNSSTGGEKCVNLPGSFRCECNDNLGFVLIDGICQVPQDDEVIVVEPEQPPPATQQDRNSSVQLRLPSFQNNQYDRSTDISFRSSIANALNSYCNEDETRRAECGLPGHGFEFSESNVFRLPNETIQVGDDLLVSFYAIYPSGTFSNSRVPVPRSVLLNALNDKLDTIVASTGVTAVIEDVDECQENTDLCSQFCQNTPGSYVCSCLPGYQLTDTFTCTDFDECAAQVDNCNGAGEICVNILRSFVCECNRTLDLGRIQGTCQELNGSVEPPPVPRNITSVEQTNSAVELNIPNFESGQFSRQTDTQLRRGIASALNSYCNVNESRRAECGLPSAGFEFSEGDIHRLPSDPVQEGSDTSVSYYALYPNGIQNGTDIPVSPQVLSRAIAERLDDIRNETGIDLLSLASDTTPSDDDEGVDWPLVLGISLAATLLLLIGLILGCVFCRKFCAAGGRESDRPVRYVYDAYRHRPRRSLNVAELEPNFGTIRSMSGETYAGYDEDGLPIDIQTDYDGLSQQAGTVSHVPTVAGSSGSSDR